MPPASLQPRLRAAGWAAALTAAATLLGAGFGLYRLNDTGPAYRPLDPGSWREAGLHASAALPASAHPRRNMAYAVQDWLEAEHPSRAQVHRRLGPGDAFPAQATEAYLVGCGFTGPGCSGQDWLVVRYSPAGKIAATSFQPADYVPVAEQRAPGRED